MRIEILAIGRCRDEAINTLVDRYIARCPWPITLRELMSPDRAPSGMLRKAEGDLLRREIKGTDRIIALDERGDSLTSQALATRLGDWRDQGIRSITILIGGADGLDRELIDAAAIKLAFGRMTWPHLLVRAMLTEQLYRASTILQGHPYHRE